MHSFLQSKTAELGLEEKKRKKMGVEVSFSCLHRSEFQHEAYTEGQCSMEPIDRSYHLVGELVTTYVGECIWKLGGRQAYTESKCKLAYSRCIDTHFQ